MSFSGPKILKANFSLGPVGGASSPLTDYSDQITQIIIGGAATMIDIPPTGTTGASKRKGKVDWTCQIDWLASDSGSGDLTRRIYDALIDDDGFLYVSGTYEAGAASSSNPRWAGTIIASGMGLGGQQEQLATDSQTFPMLAAPSYTFS